MHFLLLLACTSPADSGSTGTTKDTGTTGTTDSETDSGTTQTDSDTDSGTTDSGTTDSGTTDSGTTDSGTTDSGTTDSGTTDTGITDTGITDTGITDTGGGTTTACTTADLIWDAEVRDSTGVAGVSFPKGTQLTMAAVIRNPCSNDIRFNTPDTCLTTGWEVVNSKGMGSGVAVACAGVITSWTVPAGSTLEETMSWGKEPIDSYVFKVTYNYGGNGASVNFSIY